MNKLIKTLLTSILLLSVTYAKTTPSDVYTEAKAIKIAFAQEVIHQKGVSLLPIIDIDLRGATPASVYAMGSVINYKLKILAKSKNKTWNYSPFPNKKITPKHVKDVLLVVQKNINNIFGNNNFIRTTVEGKKPADVMVQLTYANLWLDKIMPFVKPQYPYVALQMTEEIIESIASENEIAVFQLSPKLHANITPNDVFINVTATYNLLRNIKLIYSKQSSPSHPYDILSAKNKIKPLDIYTITIFNLFFLYTSAIDLGIDDIDTSKSLSITGNIKPNNVFRQSDIVNAKLTYLLASGGLQNDK